MKTRFNHLFHFFKWPSIRKNPWRQEKEIIKLQTEALKKIIAHAYDTVPYYRGVFDERGLKPHHVKSLDDLTLLPVLTKDNIRENYPHRILSDTVDWNQCSPRMTSGSSGKKLEVVLDLKGAALYRLMQLRQLLDVGYRPWDKISYIRYSPPITKIALQNLKLFRRMYIPLEWSPERQATEIIETRPQIINAYPSVLYLLARTIGQDGGKSLHLKFLMSNSELLTGQTREFLEDVFQCKVYDDYSCLEFSAIGSECRMQKLHVASDNVIIEVLDKDNNRVPPGKPGKIILTALNNFSMPYIRYEIGDVGILGDKKCMCGRNFPVLESILGRCDDFIAMPSGELIDPQTIVFQIEVIKEVREFRVTQHEDYNLKVQIVPEAGVDFQAIHREIDMNLKSILDKSVSVEIMAVPQLERGATGKHRSIISQVAVKN
jgi:phenylacetate-CoA ligase